MQIDLQYGRTGMVVDLPEEGTTVIEPTYLPGLPDQTGALITAMRNPIGTAPLRQLVRADQTVAISVCDVTRPMPSATVLPALLGELSHVPREQISIMIAAGTHRATTPEELDEMLGVEVARNYLVVNHDAFDDNGLVHVGDTTGGIPIWLNKRWVESDVRITTGFVEPHFFAGFSGGPKMVAPGLAGFKSIIRLHGPAMVSHPKSVWGIIDGNPIQEAFRQIVTQTGVDFSVDVTINRAREITSVYAGELLAVHKAACGVSKRASMRGVKEPFDVVVTTNSGYPLDLNMYQAIKGISAAAQVVREGGTIISAAECSDGIPDHGEYRKILAEADTPEGLLELVNTPGFDRHDQWQIQAHAQILLKARVLLKSSYLSPEQVRAGHLEPIEDVEEAVAEALERHGPGSSLCVLPEGPQTIPFLEQ